MTDGTGTWSWTWDSLHRLTSVTEARNGTVSYAYDLRNLPTQITYPGGLTRHPRLRRRRRWTSVNDWLGNTHHLRLRPRRQPHPRTLPASTGVVDTSSFDDADRLHRDHRQARHADPVRRHLHPRPERAAHRRQLRAIRRPPLPLHAAQPALLRRHTNTTACSSPPVRRQPLPLRHRRQPRPRPARPRRASTPPTSSAGPSPHPRRAPAPPPAGATTYSYDPRGNRTAVTPPAGARDHPRPTTRPTGSSATRTAPPPPATPTTATGCA